LVDAASFFGTSWAERRGTSTATNKAFREDSSTNR
jgi:hypothetical protein